MKLNKSEFIKKANERGINLPDRNLAPWLTLMRDLRRDGYIVKRSEVLNWVYPNKQWAPLNP